MFTAALFDYNGVLVDDEHVHLDAFRETLKPHGVGLTEADYWERYLGYDDAGAFRAILEDAGRVVTDELIASLIEAKRPIYLGLARGALRAFPGAAELVRSLASRGPVAIVSGALRDEIELGLDVLGVRSVVGKIVSAEDTRAGKPDPEGYIRGARWIAETAGGECAAHALVIEDSLSGIQAAKLAGLTCLAVAHSYPEAELSAAGADGVAARIEDVSLEMLEALYRHKHA